MFHHSKGTAIDIIWFFSLQWMEAWTMKVCAIYMMHWKTCSAQAFWFWGAYIGEGLTLLPPLTVAPKTPQQRRYHGYHDCVWLYRHIGCKATVQMEPYTWPTLLHLEKLVSRPKKESWCIIIKDGTALKTAILWFMSIPSWHTSGRLTDELVCRDKITYFVLIHCDSSLTIFN